MPPAPLASRALEDQLRRMQLQIDALERRQATGDAMSWNARFTGGTGNWATMGVTGFYVRLNNILFAWATYYFDATSLLVSSGFNIPLPYPVDDVVSGTWTAYYTTPGTPNIRTGPLGVLSYPATTAVLYLPLAGTASSTMTTTAPQAFQAGDRLDVWVVGRIPDGS